MTPQGWPVQIEVSGETQTGTATRKVIAADGRTYIEVLGRGWFEPDFPARPLTLIPAEPPPDDEGGH